MITLRSLARAAAVLRATMSSVSPRYARRSEGPVITHWHQPLSIAGETSPVYAPDSSQKQSWAPSLTVVPSITSAIPSSHGYGGKIATSTSSGWLVAEGITPLTRSRASPALTGFIFQLAASRALGLTRAGTGFAATPP